MLRSTLIKFIRIAIIALGFIILSCKSTQMVKHIEMTENQANGTQRQISSKPYIQKDSNDQLKFIDSSTGNVISIINVDTNNPFKRKYTDFMHSSQYIIFPDKKNLAELIPSDKFKNYDRQIEGLRVDRATTRSVFYNNDNCVAIGYSINYIGGDVFLGCQSELSVLNSSGEILLNLKDIEVNINEITITDDCKYLCFSYGLDDEFGTLLNDGYKIYNVSTKQLVAEERYSDEYHSILPKSLHNHILLMMIKKAIISYYVMYDFNESIRYRYEYQPGLDKELIQINEKGFVFKKNEIYDTVTFKNDLQQETF